MATYKIAVLPGDGIGPEIIAETVKVLLVVEQALGGPDLELEHLEAGAGLYRSTGVAISDEVFQQCRRADAMLLGAIGLPDVRRADGTEVAGDVMFKLRFELDLFAGVRPVRLFAGISGPLRCAPAGIDYVVVRENVEGLYASRDAGCRVRDDLVADMLIITATGTRKIVKHAFELARRRAGRPSDGKRVVTCVDKSNVLASYAFFREIFDEVAEAYADIGREYAYVDAMAAALVLKPQIFDVIVTENMFGDILSDLAGATVGGLGMAPSADIGGEHGLFQPAHGSAPDIAGKNEANPVAAVLSAAMMLEWLGERNSDDEALKGARAICAAVETVLREGEHLTPDLGGHSGTAEMGEAFGRAIEKQTG